MVLCNFAMQVVTQMAFFPQLFSMKVYQKENKIFEWRLKMLTKNLYSWQKNLYSTVNVRQFQLNYNGEEPHLKRPYEANNHNKDHRPSEKTVTFLQHWQQLI